jgi:hypothetical protein
MGESLAIIGDNDELGCWKDYAKTKMTWTEGHVWRLDNYTVKSRIFQYKYVII